MFYDITFSTETITFVKEKMVDWQYLFFPKIKLNKYNERYCHHCDHVMMLCFKKSLHVKERHIICSYNRIRKRRTNSSFF